KGKVRVMAIMTGVQSAQVLGPTTQKQANKSRAAIEDVDVSEDTFDASANVENDFGGSSSTGQRGFGETDGGRDAVEKNNGLDVVRTD
ncbi:MAG: cell division protein FtsZ, partial [Halorhabdus sp.]